MDLFEKILADQGPLGSHADEWHGYFTYPKLEGEIQPWMNFQGKKVLTWSLNNYLGLANHPEVRKADTEATAEWGMAYPMGSRMMSGNSTVHEELEAQLSEFVNKEDTVLLNFGYQGVVSVIDALIDRKDAVVYDSQSHACIIDGLRMHMGKRFVYPHNNIENLDKQLERAQKVVDETGGAILVITEGVFGMAGSLGKLQEIVALKKKHNFRLFVDDAHGFGTMGATGAGTGEHLGVQDEIDVYFSTFAKSMATIGAFVSSQKDVCRYLRYNMRSQIFAKSLPMPIVKGAMKRLDMLRNRPELRENLWKVVTSLQDGLKTRGFNIGQTQSPVTPVFLKGGTNEAGHIVIDLRTNYNIFCSIVVFPVVPKDVIMLRIIPTAAHSLEDVEKTLNAFEIIAKNLQAGKYNKPMPTLNEVMA